MTTKRNQDPYMEGFQLGRQQGLEQLNERLERLLLLTPEQIRTYLVTTEDGYNDGFSDVPMLRVLLRKLVSK